MIRFFHGIDLVRDSFTPSESRGWTRAHRREKTFPQTLGSWSGPGFLELILYKSCRRSGLARASTFSNTPTPNRGNRMHRLHLTTLVALLGLLGSGCTIMAPQYSASIENVQKLKDGGNYTAKVGEFTSMNAAGKDQHISLRGSSLVSPYQGSYASYLAESIKLELIMAGKMTPGANVEISGVLLKNNMNITGFSQGLGDIEARFVVKQNGQVRYDKIKSVHNEWESSFAGSIAIPRAVQEYPRLVQALLNALYADNDFLQALK